MQVDLLITNALILTIDPQHTIFCGGTLVVNDGRIIAVLQVDEPHDFSAVRTIDADGGIVMPGMINGHTHLPMSLFRGLGDDANTQDVIFKIMFPLEKQFVNPDFVYLGALLSIAEMLLGGVTCFADMYYFESMVAKASKLLGMRAIVGETIMKYPTPDAKDPYGGIEIAEQLIEEYKNDPLITPALAPHAPYTVDTEYLQMLNRLAIKHNVPLLMHLSELDVDFELKDVPDRQDLTSVGYMSRLDLLDGRSKWVFAHCIRVNDADITLLRRAHAGVAPCAASNAKCAMPIGPAYKMFKAGVRIGLGTDGAMTGGKQDLLSHLSFVARSQKTQFADSTIMKTRDVVTMATMGGARALGMEKDIGSIEVGKKADVIILKPGLCSVPNYDPYSTLVYGCDSSAVKTVIVDGKVVVDDRRLVNADLSEIVARANALAEIIKRWYMDNVKDVNLVTTQSTPTLSL